MALVQRFVHLMVLSKIVNPQIPKAEPRAPGYLQKFIAH